MTHVQLDVGSIVTGTIINNVDIPPIEENVFEKNALISLNII